MNDDDIDEVLKEKWFNLNLCNNELINQLTDILADLTKSLEQQHMLRYQGKFYFVICKYEQAFEYLTKLLELEPNDLFALRYRGEIHHIMKRYEESLMDLDKLLEININETSTVNLKELSETNNDITWILNAYEEVARKWVFNIFIKVVYYHFYINCISVKLLESKHCIFSKFHNDFVIK